MNKWQKQVKRELSESPDVYPDKVVCHKDGSVSVWRGYFYHHGMTAERWATKVITTLSVPATVVKFKDDYKHWPKDSYFKVWIKGV